MTRRSKGSSKIIGAAIVPTMALPMAILGPLWRARYRMTKKAITAELYVNFEILWEKFRTLRGRFSFFDVSVQGSAGDPKSSTDFWKGCIGETARSLDTQRKR